MIPSQEAAPHPMTRRDALRAGAIGGGALLAAACAPAAAPAAQAPAAPAAAPVQPAWEKEWDQLVAAAKQEGKVVVNFTGAGASWRKIGEAFEAAFPGITAEVTTFGSSRLWTPRVVQEWQAGIVNWDITQIQTDDIVQTLMPAGMIAPTRADLIRPDVLDDNAWHRGYEFGWVDAEKKHGFGFGWRGLNAFYINRDLVKPGEIKSARDLLDPKWKGKMIFGDPRIYGGTFYPAAAIKANLGEDVVKRLFTEQEPTYSRDFRQITEQLIRGRFAVATGVTGASLEEFRAAGLADKVHVLDLPDAFLPVITPIWKMNKAPHPNAAKLFLNWFFTKEGQISYTQSSTQNSRRKDVPIVDKDNVVDNSREYKRIVGTLETLQEGQKMEQFFQELLK